MNLNPIPCTPCCRESEIESLNEKVAWLVENEHRRQERWDKFTNTVVGSVIVALIGLLASFGGYLLNNITHK
jgi:hypothetical protein